MIQLSEEILNTLTKGAWLMPEMHTLMYICEECETSFFESDCFSCGAQGIPSMEIDAVRRRIITVFSNPSKGVFND